YLVLHDHFLRDALGRLGGEAGVVLDDELDLAAGHRVAVLRHVETRRGFDLLAGRSEGSRQWQDEADLERVGRIRSTRQHTQCREKCDRLQHAATDRAVHRVLLRSWNFHADIILWDDRVCRGVVGTRIQASNAAATASGRSIGAMCPQSSTIASWLSGISVAIS